MEQAEEQGDEGRREAWEGGRAAGWTSVALEPGTLRQVVSGAIPGRANGQAHGA